MHLPRCPTVEIVQLPLLRPLRKMDRVYRLQEQRLQADPRVVVDHRRLSLPLFLTRLLIIVIIMPTTTTKVNCRPPRRVPRLDLQVDTTHRINPLKTLEQNARQVAQPVGLFEHLEAVGNHRCPYGPRQVQVTRDHRVVIETKHRLLRVAVVTIRKSNNRICFLRWWSL